MKKQLLWLLLTTMGLVAGITACSGQKETESAAAENKAEEETVTETEGEAGSSGAVVDAAILVQGYEWGPGVSKIILELEQEATEIGAENWTIVTADAERTVKDVYICDEYGEKTDAASSHVAVEMETTYENPGLPFTYDKSVSMNKWKETYDISVECTDMIFRWNVQTSLWTEKQTHSHSPQIVWIRSFVQIPRCFQREIPSQARIRIRLPERRS